MPKIITRTTQIIAEMEREPRPGFVGPGQRAQFNVAIRAILVDRAN